MKKNTFRSDGHVVGTSVRKTDGKTYANHVSECDAKLEKPHEKRHEYVQKIAQKNPKLESTGINLWKCVEKIVKKLEKVHKKLFEKV